MIAIVNYGMGNLHSVHKGFEKVGHKSFITNDPDDIYNASAVVLPGVGAFSECIKNLKKLGLAEAIQGVIQRGKPFLGICLGLQMLFTKSEEDGIHDGMDIIKGRVVRFPSGDIKIPHIGWNNIQIEKNSPIMRGIDNGAYMYFVHSYYVLPEDETVINTTTEYGIRFVSSIAKGNIFAVQFHPEKSQRDGLTILKNFGDI